MNHSKSGSCDDRRPFLFQIMMVGGDNEVIQGLSDYFTKQNGYEVVSASDLEDALSLCRVHLPNWIVLDRTKPDLANDDNCRKILFPFVEYTFILPAKQYDGLLLSPYEIIFKPFQPQELIDLIKKTLKRRYEAKLKHPITFLPTKPFIEEQFRVLVRKTRPWRVVAVRINNFSSFVDEYGVDISNDVLRDVTLMLEEAVHMLRVEDLLDAYRKSNVVIGHIAPKDFFLFIILDQDVAHIKTYLEKCFMKSIEERYGNRSALPISLSVGAISSEDGPFPDILEMTKLLVARLTAG